MPTAQHTACTIEMTNLVKRVDVAVIDEGLSVLIAMNLGLAIFNMLPIPPLEPAAAAAPGPAPAAQGNKGAGR